MFLKHLLPLCHTYDPCEPGQIAHGDPRYLNWKLEKHAYAHVVKLIKEEKCYVQEMDDRWCSDSSSNLSLDIDTARVAECWPSPTSLVGSYAALIAERGYSSKQNVTSPRCSTPCVTLSSDESTGNVSTKGYLDADPLNPSRRKRNAFNILMKRRPRHRSWQEPKPESAKETYQRLLCDLKIRNDKQYDAVIAENKQLKTAESLCGNEPRIGASGKKTYI